jgi:tetratricopeptide (TPR) repeat protein
LTRFSSARAVALAELFLALGKGLFPPCYNEDGMTLCEKRSLQHIAPLLLALIAPPCALSQTTGDRELSHQERFAPTSKSIEKAESELSAKLAADPKDASLLSSRGLLRLQLSKGPEGIADLRMATEVAPVNVQLHINLAYGLLLNQKLEESIAEDRKALALEDKSYAAHALLGRALVANGGDSKEATKHLQRSLDLYPEQTDLRFELVNALRKQKDFPAAGVQLRILKDQLPPGDARLEYAQGLLSADLGYPEAAAASFRRALQSNPNSLTIRQDFGAVLVRMGKWSEAASVLGPLALARPDSPLVAYLNALALQNSQHSKEAEAEARRSLALDSNSADTHTLLGITLSSQGRIDEAISELNRAVEIDPNSFDGELYLGRSRYARSDTAGAAAALQKAVSLRPQDAEARFFLGTVLEVAGDQDGATTQYQELQQISPNDPRGYVGLGGIFGKTGKNEEALAQLRKARELDPANFETNLALGRLLAKTGNLEESIQFLQEAEKQSPQSPEVHYQLALSLQRAGRKAEAAKQFAEVDRLNRERRSTTGMGMDAPRP